ncbi:MAG: RNA polymerase sigma factor [Pseudomonadota bacterium]
MSSTTILYSRHRRQLIHMARAIVRDEHLAEELVQEAFLQFSKRQNPDQVKSPLAYLKAIVRNLCVDSIKKSLRDAELKGLYQEDLIDVSLGQPNINPEHSAVWKSEYQTFETVVNELPRITQQAIWLHLIDGLEFRQIAKRLDISVGKAHYLVSDALELCSQKMNSKATKQKKNKN